MSEKTIGELALDYEHAKLAHTDAVKETSRARNVETDAFNTLNRAQEAISKHFEKLKKEAPRDSVWNPSQLREIKP